MLYKSVCLAFLLLATNILSLAHNECFPLSFRYCYSCPSRYSREILLRCLRPDECGIPSNPLTFNNIGKMRLNLFENVNFTSYLPVGMAVSPNTLFSPLFRLRSLPALVPCLCLRGSLEKNTPSMVTSPSV